MKPLLVGEFNPHSRVDDHALLPWPAGATGDRLRRILGLTPQEYMRTFARTNLLMSPGWSSKLAREVALGLYHKRRILLGAKVCAAHRLPFKPFKFFNTGEFVALVLPHPSGRNRLWNDRKNLTRARRAVSRFLKES